MTLMNIHDLDSRHLAPRLLTALYPYYICILFMIHDIMYHYR